MATSAFRSTTRRSTCSGKPEPAVPSTPRSKRDPSPSGRTFHRRSTSMTDFSAKYLSDCSSTTDFRASRNRTSGAYGGRRSVCPSDSESDMECLSAHRPMRRWGAESEDERKPTRRWGAESEDEGNLRYSVSGVNKLDSQNRGLRRISSSQDFSQYNNKQRHATITHDQPGKKSEQDDTEDYVEEKTIRAVFAQMKSLRSDPPVGDVGMTDFLDAMRSEVRRAVADIRTELEESMRKNGKLSSAFEEGNGSSSQGIDVTQAVAEIRKEYSAKLEESEKRVQELWSQIAVEERRCLELSKIVKELLPTTPPPPTTTATSHTTSNRRRPLRRKNSAEKQFTSKSLDDEAQKYFDECVSISSLECPADSDDSMREKENNSRSHRKVRSGDADSTVKSGLLQGDVKGELQKKDFVIGSDGVVLPWLQWEAEAAGANDNNTSQGNKKHLLTKGNNCSGFERFSGNNNQFYRSNNPKANAVRKSSGKNFHDPLQTELLEPLCSEGMQELGLNKTVQTGKPLHAGKTSSMSLFTVDDQVAETYHPLVDEETLILERIKFRCRVENGQLLLCQGLFLM